MFRAGDRVQCISGAWYDDVSGITGTVMVHRRALNEIGVKFDKPVRYNRGNNLGGFLDEDEKPYGYWIYEEDLMLVKSTNREVYDV